MWGGEGGLERRSRKTQTRKKKQYPGSGDAKLAGDFLSLRGFLMSFVGSLEANNPVFGSNQS